jgi:hypothetical protein
MVSAAVYTAALSATLVGMSVGTAYGDATTQPAVKSAAAAVQSTDNSSNYRESRSSRRNRGNRNESKIPAVSIADPYAVLRGRSIFVKGNQTITSDSSPSRPAGDSGLANHPGSALIFNGVIMVGDEANAMIEDTSSQKVTLVKAGDLIAAGKVSEITFDSLTYEANGQQKQVSLGENMDGVVPSNSVLAPASAGAPPVGGAASTAAAGVAPPATSAGGGSGASPDEILARMRAKRNQELGIK